MSLRQLSKLKPVYIIPRDDLTGEVLMPSLAGATRYDIMTAFFSSRALKEIAPGLIKFISVGQGKIRLIISPHLSEEDQDAILRGIENAPEVLEKWFAAYIRDSLIDEYALTRYTLECLSLLISRGDIKIKLAIMKNGAMFHEKVSIISDVDDTIVIHGSTNFTLPGYTANKENARLERSWASESESLAVSSFVEEFEINWNNEDEKVVIFSISKGFKQKIISDYTPEKSIRIEKYWDILIESRRTARTLPINMERKFAIPDHIQYEDGVFAHQGKAVTAWLDNDGIGTLQMCTGSGKTIASLICAHKLYEKIRPLFIIISAPYLPLIHQWGKETKRFGLRPILTAGLSRNQRIKQINKAVQRIKFGSTDVESAVVTNNFLCDEEFKDIMKKCQSDVLLIGDEMHNLGTKKFLSDIPEFISYRIGLSATPVRQYDEIGTEQLLDFFGKVVFEFGLQEAIGTCLIPYNYYVHPVALSPQELNRWLELTDKIRKLGWTIDDQTIDNPLVEKYLRERRIVVELASGKLKELKRLLLLENPKSIKHTLIYASDKCRDQLNGVNQLLIDGLGILMHQVTSEETNSGLSQAILDQFADGTSLQVLTAMRVLDEGVDIPQVDRAFILASTTVERQWVQRRGRILRKCEKTNKKIANIHDFFVFASELVEYSSLIKGEIRRVFEFAKLSENSYRDDGPMKVIEPFIELIQ